MEKEYSHSFNMKGQNLHFSAQENQQDKNLCDSPSLMNYTISLKNRNIRVIKETGVHNIDNVLKILSETGDSKKMNYNPIFNNNIKGKNNYI